MDNKFIILDGAADDDDDYDGGCCYGGSLDEAPHNMQCKVKQFIMKEADENWIPLIMLYTQTFIAFIIMFLLLLLLFQKMKEKYFC